METYVAPKHPLQCKRNVLATHSVNADKQPSTSSVEDLTSPVYVRLHDDSLSAVVAGVTTRSPTGAA